MDTLEKMFCCTFNCVTLKQKKQILQTLNTMQISISDYRICISGVYISHYLIL